jgi:peptidoglycan hydrolase-like protein with peptidoglycan-binding domain
MFPLIEFLPIILRFVQAAPQLQQALRVGQSALDDRLAATPDLKLLLQQLGQSQFPGIPNELSHIIGAQTLFDPAGAKWVQSSLNKWVQLSLNLLGAQPQLAVDGSYGPATKAAVAKFQSEHGLVVDGWAGDATGDALRAALATEVRSHGAQG